jgi:beta-1,4-mannosyl-glycoprotein beta-1,4-N-acetylglucosaminyltransferase
MIVDCFTFFDELDLLELRFEALDTVVDRFVLCEAPFTFRGDPKPLAFANARERFARWRERIVPLVYPQPASPNPWINEWGQRDYLSAGLAGFSDDDLVLIGDCDQSPDPANAARRPSPGRILAHRQRYSAGYVNRVAEEPWIGTRAIALGDIKRFATLSEVRKQPREALEYVDGGWHFTSLGGPATQARKFRSASHAEVDLPYFYDLRKLEVTFAAEAGGRKIAIDASFPEPIRTDPRWAPYIWGGPSLTEPDQVAALEHAHGLFAYVPDNAAAVAVISTEPTGWEAAGRERFGTRWAGVSANPPPAGTAPWVVVDGFERFGAGTLAGLHGSGANVVLFGRNARSFAVFRDVLGGGGFPAGTALGLPEYEARIAAAGYIAERTDYLRTAEVFVAWASMPEVMYGVSVGPFGIGEVAREVLRAFLSDAFIFVLRVV